MSKIFYLSRSYYPYQKGGGAQMRKGAVDHLRRLGWDVTVVLPNYGSDKLVEDDKCILLPLNYRLELGLFKQRIGLQEDYLDKWTKTAFDYLSDKVKSNDILFATTGGELGLIKLASLLKQKTGCKYVVNYRDPILEGRYLGKVVEGRFHVSRDRVEAKYLDNVDLVLTFSEKFKTALVEKFPGLEKKIHSNYFGYPRTSQKIKTKMSADGKIRIAFAGRMGKFQKPDRLLGVIQRCENRDNIELYFIGVFTKYLPFKKLKNVHVIDFIPPDELTDLLLEKIDIGFVSLSDAHHIFGVPSKIYEYLNLGLPILAAVPDADGKNIINNNGYGIACVFSDTDCLVKALDRFFMPGEIDKFRENIINDREKWSMGYRISEVDEHLKNIIN